MDNIFFKKIAYPVIALASSLAAALYSQGVPLLGLMLIVTGGAVFVGYLAHKFQTRVNRAQAYATVLFVALVAPGIAVCLGNALTLVLANFLAISAGAVAGYLMRQAHSKTEAVGSFQFGGPRR
jgi:hypothetical protein